MPYRFDIYIGSENGSRSIGENYLKKVQDWASQIFPEGYTLLKSNGYYQGTSEESLIVNVLCEYDVALKQQIERLKRELKQGSILVVKSAVDLEVI